MEHSAVAFSPDLRRVVRHQVFLDPSCAGRNQTAILVVARRRDPAEDGIRPFATRQETVGRCSERRRRDGMSVWCQEMRIRFP